MNDFDFDIVEKKRIARGARCKKNGSKSKCCTLPSDNLTPAQRKALSGPVSSYSMNQTMEWPVFKSIQKDLQQSYIDTLQSRFGVPVSTISKELFGLSSYGLRSYMTRNGMRFVAERGKRLSAEERQLWEDFLNGCVRQEEPESGTDQETDDSCEDGGGVEMPEAVRFMARNISAEFVGTFDPHEFVKAIAQLPIPGGKVRVRVEVVQE